MTRIAIIASASGNGKTTLARALSSRTGAPWLELDALVQGPNWVQTPNDELRALVTPFLAQPAWIVDGVYRSKLGNLILDAADLVVWLDLPMRVWLPRLVRRTARRIAGVEPLWNGNRESIRGALWGKDALIPFALRMHYRRRRIWPTELAGYQVIRLRTVDEVAGFLVSYAQCPS